MAYIEKKYQRGFMSKHWKHLASALVLTSALIPAISTAQVPAPSQSRSQAPSVGMDPVVLDKASGGDACPKGWSGAHMRRAKA